MPGLGCRRGGIAAAAAVAMALAGLGAGLAQAQSASGAAGGPAWAHRALELQYELTGDVGLRNAPWVGTHNSFNSAAEMGTTLSTQDSNQRISIVDQLNSDMRKIELDLHWFFRPDQGGFAPIVCHARGEDEAHAGCTLEKPLGSVLEEIAGWLRANPDQVVLVQLEDHLEEAAGHDGAAAILQEKLGTMIYRPAGAAAGECTLMPPELTRNQARAAGAQVILVSKGCGPGTVWRSTVFDWANHLEDRPLGYREYPACDKDFTRSQYDSTQVRYYEDSTSLTEGASQFGAADKRDRMTAQTAARMARCGVDIIEFDQFTADDPRLESVVWSWAPGEPTGGGCALQIVDADNAFGRWHSSPCKLRRRAACRKASGKWVLTKRKVPERRARRLCKRRRAAHAVPRSGYEAQLLREVMERKKVSSAWIGYRLRRGEWQALDRRG